MVPELAEGSVERSVKRPKAIAQVQGMVTEVHKVSSDWAGWCSGYVSQLLGSVLTSAAWLH